MRIINRNEAFHVHTARCRHAGTDPDEAYVLEAIRVGADAIVFTDHAPFPGDRFRNRMLCSELPGYIRSLEHLKEKYAGKIDVRIGLEIEWLPEYRSWMEALRADRQLDFLLLGQHFYATGSGKYSFETKDRPSEAEGIARDR